MTPRKILYIGSYVDEKSTIGIPNVAGNLYEEKLLDIFYKIRLFETISVLSSRPFKSDFKISSLNVITEQSVLKESSLKINYVPLLNFKGLKYIFSFFYIFLFLLRWNIFNAKYEKYVVVYNPFSYRVIPCLVSSFIFKQKNIMIVADLPVGSLSKKTSLINKFIFNLQLKSINWFKNLILITESIKTDFNLSNKNTIIYEGHITNDFLKFEKFSQNHSDEKFSIVYAGSLDRGSGIDFILNLVDEISTRPFFDSLSFEVYGDGYFKNDILKKEKINSLISYKGIIDRNKLYKIYQNANVLILPRDPDDVLTKYTFPSKLFEYLFYGNQIISNRLEGIPKDYLPFLTIPKDKTIDSWIDTIQEIISSLKNSEVDTGGAREFLIKKKNIESFLFDFKTFILLIK